MESPLALHSKSIKDFLMSYVQNSHAVVATEKSNETEPVALSERKKASTT